MRSARVCRPGPDSSSVIRAAAGHGHQEGFGGSFDGGSGSGAPVEVGGGQGESADAFLGADGGRGAGELQGAEQAIGGDLAGQAEWAADVLVMDEAVGEGDPAAEAGGESARLQVIFHQREKVVGGCGRRRRRLRRRWPGPAARRL